MDGIRYHPRSTDGFRQATLSNIVAIWKNKGGFCEIIAEFAFIMQKTANIFQMVHIFGTYQAKNYTKSRLNQNRQNLVKWL